MRLRCGGHGGACSVPGGPALRFAKGQPGWPGRRLVRIARAAVQSCRGAYLSVSGGAVSLELEVCESSGKEVADRSQGIVANTGAELSPRVPQPPATSRV